MPAEPELRPVPTGRALGGFTNLLKKELTLWWGTYRWVWQVLLWGALLNGISFAVLYAAKAYPHDNADPLELAVQAFFTIAALGTGVGAVVAVQDAIIGERQLGTAAWVLAKPVSRSAFVLSKFLAHGFSFSVLAVMIPAVGFVLEVQRFLGVVPAPGPLLWGLALLVLNLLYYQAMMLMLSTFFQGRGAATGTALAFMFLGEIVPGLAPKLMVIAPWSFGDVGSAVALQMPIAHNMMVPVWITAATIPLFLATALMRFNQEEL